MLPEKMEFMERHTQTDEVFVLLNGQATLILGGNGPKVESIYQQVMEQGKLYNVKQNAWHTILLSRDASILIVENQDTGEENTEYCRISDEIRLGDPFHKSEEVKVGTIGEGARPMQSA